MTTQSLWRRDGRRSPGDLLAVLSHDVYLALRALRRSPAFAVAATLTLALSVGATTAVFGVVDAVLIRPLQVADPDRLVSVFEVNRERGITQSPPSGPNYLDWRRDARAFAGLAAYRQESLTLTGVSSPDVLNAAGVSANFFDVLGVPPALGRAFRPREDEAGGARVIVLGYGMWQERFGGRRDIIGRVLTIDRQPFEVVGVMPERFAFPSGMQAWRPSDMNRPTSGAGLAEGTPESRQARYISVIGRLRPDVRRAQAEQEMAGIAASLARTYPIDDGGWSTKLVPLRDTIVGSVERVLMLVLGAVGIVLALACVTVANLTLGRAIAREPEIALRSALGAGRARLHAQLLTESVMLALIGGTLGALVGWAALRAFVALAPASIPRLDEVTIDARVLTFTLGISAVTGVLCGLAPSMRIAGVGTATLLREAGRGGVGSRRSDTVRRLLVVGQMALAVLLLTGAGLMLRSVRRVLAVHPGYATERVVAGRVSLDGERYRGNRAKVRYLRELTERIASLPGVQQVGVTTTLPLTPAGIDFDLGYHAEGQPVRPPNQAPKVDFRLISPGYLEAMGIRLLEGRAFTERDRIERASDGASLTPSAPAAADVRSPKVMLVNETFARQNWPGQSAVGKHVRLFYVESDPWEVAGVVADTRHAALVSPPRPQVFVPVEQTELLFGYLTIVARTAPGASGIAAGMRRAALMVDPSEPLYDIDTIEALRSEATERERMTALIFSAFALVAVVLAAAGIYGVISYQVTRRTREIGVRMALGASRGRVVRDVVREAVVLALVGVALGSASALAAVRFVRGMLYGVAPTDPVTFGSVTVLLMAVAIAAALVPAAKASGIQPVEALRAD